MRVLLLDEVESLQSLELQFVAFDFPVLGAELVGELLHSQCVDPYFFLPGLYDLLGLQRLPRLAFLLVFKSLGESGYLLLHLLHLGHHTAGVLLDVETDSHALRGVSIVSARGSGLAVEDPLLLGPAQPRVVVAFDVRLLVVQPEWDAVASTQREGRVSVHNYD